MNMNFSMVRTGNNLSAILVYRNSVRTCLSEEGVQCHSTAGSRVVSLIVSHDRMLIQYAKQYRHGCTRYYDRAVVCALHIIDC